MRSILSIIFLLIIFLLNLFLLNKSFAYTVNENKNPIYKSIMILNPDLPRKDAMVYSNIIYKYSKVYKIDPFLIVAIARQESRINLSAVRKSESNNIIYNKISNKFVKEIELTDFCMMQIHKSNIISKNLNPEKLLNDPEYCIHEGIKILNFFKNISKNDEFWWTRYNSSKDNHREIYKNYVLSHYDKISFIVNNLSEKNILKNYLITLAD